MPAIDTEGLHFDVHGRFGDRDVRVTYSSGLLVVEGFTFTFNNDHVEYGDERITVNETEIGRLLTVQVPMFSTRQNVTFSLLMPTSVEVADGAGSGDVTALVILTNWGTQTDERLPAMYSSVVRLEGTASQDPG
jgi:hypothetical protein